MSNTKTISQIVELIADRFGKADDYPFKQSIAFSVKYWRAILLRRYLERNPFDKNLLQTICVPLEYGNTDLCCETLTGCKGMISTIDIPESLRISRDSPLYSVSKLNFKSIDYASKLSWESRKHSKFTNKDLKYDIINKKIYIKNATNLTHIYITDIWIDPETLPDCNDNDINPNCDGKAFPIPGDMIITIIEGMISLDLKIVNSDDQEVEISSDKTDKN